MKAGESDIDRLAEGRHHDPFAFLGRHRQGSVDLVRAFLPHARDAVIVEGNRPLRRIEGSDLFQWQGNAEELPEHYRLLWTDDQSVEHVGHDPYCFPPQLGDLDLHLFSEGKHWHAYRLLGARMHRVGEVGGVLFSVWAPAAERVSAVGDFNRWDGRCHPMRVRGSGVWELFVPGLEPGCLYKFEIRSRVTGAVLLKTDPYGRSFELRPQTAARVSAAEPYPWQDADWMTRRARLDWRGQPISIYEVHLGSWRRGGEGGFLDYREFAHQVVDYAHETGFTHIELLPITEHPYDQSWGYQATGYYAPTSRYGSPEDFCYLVDYCHRHGVGVFLDWVPAHFPKDRHALARFDGTALYEHEDPRLGEHMDWSTLIYNFGRYEVKNFLLSSALFWLEEFHLDGLRVDAVASMLYLDYSRSDWIPNSYGGNENLQAVAFLQELNQVVHQACPGVLMMAEESTAWPGVTRPVEHGGLGFDLKWNMGWMNDSLSYLQRDPISRKFQHEDLVHTLSYAFSENFLLPLSHDEVVHGKGSMLRKMPGDQWQRFANLRLTYAYLFTYPGKKLLFMGGEWGQAGEWDSDRPLDWPALDSPLQQGVRRLVADLNRLYRSSPELHGQDCDDGGFAWIDNSDSQHSVLAYQRQMNGERLIVALNFTPVPRANYRLGLPESGHYREVFNSDSSFYGGSNIGNGPGPLVTEERPWMSQDWSLLVTLPPLAALVLRKVPMEIMQ